MKGNRPNIFYSYKKAKKVIISCETREQLAGAKRFCNLFMKVHSEPINKRWEVNTTPIVAELYDKLKMLLYFRKHQLNKDIK
ncbi:hypothetical protein N9J42_00180 [bacterium]|nr:hypothetical protein [bacterium]